MVMYPLIQNMLVLTREKVTEADIEALEAAVLNFEYTRQSGKTTTVVHIVEVIMLFVTKLFKIPIEIGIFAPQKEQANTDFKRLKNAFARSKQDLMIVDHDANKKAKEESNAKTITLGNGSSCYIFPVTLTSKPESKTLHVIIIEEAQDINDRIVNEDILPMGASTNAVVLKVGTAGDTTCDFYWDIQKGRAYVMTYPEIAADRRRMYEMTGDARHLIYEQRVKKTIERYGLASPEVQKPYFNVWQIEAGMYIVADELFKGRITQNYDDPKSIPKFAEYLEWLKGGNRTLEQKDQWQKDNEIPDDLMEQFRVWTEANHYFGLDTAKQKDQTVLKIGREIGGRLTVVRSVQGLRGMNYEDQFDTLKHELSFFHIAAGSIDSTGQGDFMPDKFERGTGYKIYRVKFSRQTKDVMYKALYQKQVNSQFAYYWQDPVKFPLKAVAPGQQMSPEQFTAAASEEFEDEFLKLQKRYVGDMMVVAHPDEEDGHDDHPDSTALMNNAFDSYNMSSGIFQYYAEGKNAEESAGSQDQMSAIAEANKGQ